MTTLVVGAAASGTAAARLLSRLGEKVVVYDSDESVTRPEDADEFHKGPWDPRYLDEIDVVVTSPGVPPTAPPLAEAAGRGLPVWSEIELAARHLDVPLGAVTATNGKTTVTEAAASMLTASGRRAAAVGNIGRPLCDAVGGDWDALVVEASSFQLAFIDRFRASAAVLLNISPDHLDWHGSLDDYVAAKRRVLERQTAGDVVIFDVDDAAASAAVSGATASPVPVSGSRVPAGGSGRDGETLRVGSVGIPIADLAREDEAFLVDLAAAGELALHLGATADGIAAGASGYAPGRHRREVIGTRGGVTWVNDSKATNPHAAIASIRSFPSVILIAGGRAKGLDVTPVATEPGIRHLVGIGEAGPALVEAAGAGTVVADMSEAVGVAAAMARPGDTVLLAPACASFDMFSSYAQRGDAFRDAVREKGGV